MNQVEQKMERMKRCERILVKPMSSYEVSAITGWPKPSVRTYLKELHERGRIHIGAWRPSGKKVTALYVAGEGEDVEKPRTLAQLREVEEGEVFKRPETVVNVCRDPLAAALFGDAGKQSNPIDLGAPLEFAGVDIDACHKKAVF